MVISGFTLTLVLLHVNALLAENNYCDDILCSHVNDHVCGKAKTWDGIEIIKVYKNICYLRKKQCELRAYLEIIEIPDIFCNIDRGFTNSKDGRRVIDYSIVGAHQTCNHTCPIYCTDAYDPACAQIWKKHDELSTYRPMINHCHIDLFSCSTGLNVTIHPLSRCSKSSSALMFMMQVAALKSLNLLDDSPFIEESTKSVKSSKN